MIHKINHRTNSLPDDLTKADVAELRTKGLLRKFLSGPMAEHNRELIDAALAGDTKPNPQRRIAALPLLSGLVILKLLNAGFVAEQFTNLVRGQTPFVRKLCNGVVRTWLTWTKTAALPNQRLRPEDRRRYGRSLRLAHSGHYFCELFWLIRIRRRPRKPVGVDSNGF
jgi:hypothetical protein